MLSQLIPIGPIKIGVEICTAATAVKNQLIPVQSAIKFRIIPVQENVRGVFEVLLLRITTTTTTTSRMTTETILWVKLATHFITNVFFTGRIADRMIPQPNQ